MNSAHRLDIESEIWQQAAPKCGRGEKRISKQIAIAWEAAKKTKGRRKWPRQGTAPEERLLLRTYQRNRTRKSIAIFEGGWWVETKRNIVAIRLNANNEIRPILDQRRNEDNHQEEIAALLEEPWTQGLTGWNVAINKAGRLQVGWKLPPEPEFRDATGQLKQLKKWMKYRLDVERKKLTECINTDERTASEGPLTNQLRQWLKTEPWKQNKQWRENTQMKVLQLTKLPQATKETPQKKGSLRRIILEEWKGARNHPMLHAIAAHGQWDEENLKQTAEELCLNLLQPYNLLPQCTKNNEGWLILPDEIYQKTWKELATNGCQHILKNTFQDPIWTSPTIARCKTNEAVYRILQSKELEDEKPFLLLMTQLL